MNREQELCDLAICRITLAGYNVGKGKYGRWPFQYYEVGAKKGARDYRGRHKHLTVALYRLMVQLPEFGETV